MESNCIIDSPRYKTMATIVAVAMGIFQLIVAGYGFIVTNMRCAIHLTFAMTLIGIYKPVRFKNYHLTDFYNITFTIIAAVFGTLLTYETRADYALSYVLNGASDFDVVIGTVIIILVLICARRTTGNILTLICLIFILYAVWGQHLPGLLTHKAYKWRSIIDVIVFTSEGLFGQPLSISSSYVASFVMFGSFLAITGAGQWFIDMAYSLTGRLRSGPAMTAVVSSAAMGTISGTGVAIVVTTGSFTIPLMKSCGYSAKIAGAISATASTGGQIMPPIMGAGAFILAEMIGVPYGKVAIAAILPAVLYFLAVAFQVDFEAGRLGLHGLPADKLPPRMKTFKEGWLFLIPILVLIWALCIVSYSANYSALYAIAVILVIGFTFKMRGERLTIKKVFEAIARGARDMLSIAMACSVAGLMIGVLTKTGLGLKFTALLLSISGGAKLTTLILTMIGCTILGMGLPTTAAFIITATLCAPALIQLQITPLAAYMFVFYYACLSAITPPVALAAFAAAGLSGAKPLDTGVSATRLGLAGFLIPFFFCFTPAMLFQGSVSEIIRVSITSLIGIYLLSGGLEGFMYVKLNFLERVLLVAAALLMVDQGWLTDVLGLGIGVAIILLQVRELRKNKIANKL
ncbi:MAG: TRAP transporter permease [Pyramidobacter sp.]|jgi:TRAP transporter 4TM/12TM fusion protein